MAVRRVTRGRGVATNSIAQAHGNVQFWEHPLFEGEKVEVNCIKCHADVQDVEFAENIARGEKLFMQVGCTGCHLVEGYGEARKIGPHLRRVAAKADPSWLVEWVTNPHEFSSPDPHAALLFDPRAGQGPLRLICLMRARTRARPGSHHILSRRALIRPTPLWSNGAKPWPMRSAVGAVICSKRGKPRPLVGSAKTYAPLLARIAEKTSPRWLYHWIKNPRDYSPHTAMPSLRLTDDEARAIVSYLMTLGEKTGCLCRPA